MTRKVAWLAVGILALVVVFMKTRDTEPDWAKDFPKRAKSAQKRNEAKAAFKHTNWSVTDEPVAATKKSEPPPPPPPSLARLAGQEVARPLTMPWHSPCPDCGKQMVVMPGHKRRFITCTGFPECKKTMPYPEERAKR